MTGKHEKKETPRSRLMCTLLAFCRSSILHTSVLEVSCGCAAIILMERLVPVPRGGTVAALHALARMGGM